ncbi:hypothetical protein [Erwinia piriflorinigrans]|uniref:Uncharacterized protein n=1 Tax=Erwinia piriflorinigrans CFBP 5888 TaxID=1161919 RepID=V5ZA35_9GAMM|nr:hypothetical protein [Erwinia piriflorinigrans]CCG88223.1 hypothetical protein EPIR_2860 [Erwinia piriflorinigrans CFBP 5888]
MNELIHIELTAVSGGDDFSYVGLAGAVGAGAVTGALTGAALGGIGAGPGAIGGAAIAGAGYSANHLVQGAIDHDPSWWGWGYATLCEQKGMGVGYSC